MVTTSPSHESPEAGPKWHCLRTQPKRDHVAAVHLARSLGIPVFAPRIQFRKRTVRGPVRVTEPLFPSYIFARFDWGQHFRAVQASAGVAGVVHFGSRWPTIPEGAIEELRLDLGGSDFAVEAMEMEEGSEVMVAGGVFDGLRGLLVRVLPARERVRVLLDFLGRKLEVELPPESLVSDFRGFRFCVSDAAGVPVGRCASPGAIPV